MTLGSGLSTFNNRKVIKRRNTAGNTTKLYFKRIWPCVILGALIVTSVAHLSCCCHRTCTVHPSPLFGLEPRLTLSGSSEQCFPNFFHWRKLKIILLSRGTLAYENVYRPQNMIWGAFPSGPVRRLGNNTKRTQTQYN